MTKTKGWTIAGLSTIAAALTVVSKGGEMWPAVGWHTPNQHNADLVLVRAEIATKFTAVGEDVKQFRDEWKCDEWDEELSELYAQQQAGDDSERLRDKIKAQREKMDKLGCDKFEDY